MNRNHATPFRSALVISPNRNHLRMDRAFLRTAGVEDISGGNDVKRELIRLTETPVDVVLLDADLGVTSGAQAASLLRKRRSLDRIPIVMTSLTGGEQDVLDALASGCSGFLVRPYSVKTFIDQLGRAARGINPGTARKAAFERARLEAERGRHERARLALEEVVSSESEARSRYEKGLEHLAEKRFTKAIHAFSGAVSVNSLYAEAFVGLAKTYKEMGDPKRARQNMRRAAKAFALRDEMSRTRQALVRILRDDPETENPFMTLGFNLVRQGDFAAAGRAYALAEHYSPLPEVGTSASRACHFTRDPMRSAKLLSEAFAEATGADNAPAVFKSIMGDVPPRIAEAASDKAKIASEPTVMQDFWAVLKYTYKMYRNGGPLPSGQPIALDI